MKKLSILFLTIIAMVLVACGSDDTGSDEIKPNNTGVNCGAIEFDTGTDDLGDCTLRVAVENAYPPFSLIDLDSGDAVGYDYDIFNAICESYNCTPDFVETSWDAMVAAMGGDAELSTFDVGADGISITEERAEHVDFSIPYISSSQVLLVRADEDRFTEPEELTSDESLIVGTQIGTTNYDTSVELVGEDRVTAYDQFGTAVQSLINGDIDAIIIDNVAGLGYVGENSDKLKTTGEPVMSDDLGFIFKKGSTLAPVIDDALNAMSESGQLDEIYEVWFTEAE